MRGAQYLVNIGCANNQTHSFIGPTPRKIYLIAWASRSYSNAHNFYWPTLLMDSLVQLQQPLIVDHFFYFFLLFFLKKKNYLQFFGHGSLINVISSACSKKKSIFSANEQCDGKEFELPLTNLLNLWRSLAYLFIYLKVSVLQQEESL